MLYPSAYPPNASSEPGVLGWKKSIDPDVKDKTAKARLVLVGWQDPELGKIQTHQLSRKNQTASSFLFVLLSDGPCGEQTLRGPYFR